MNIHTVDGKLYHEKISRKLLSWISNKFDNGEVPHSDQEKSLFVKESIPDLNNYIKEELSGEERQELINDHIIMADTLDLTIPKGYDYYSQLVNYASETEED